MSFTATTVGGSELLRVLKHLCLPSDTTTKKVVVVDFS